MIQVQLKGTNVTGVVSNLTLNRVTSVRGTVRGNGFNMINVRDGNGGRVIIRNSAFSSLNTMQSDGKVELTLTYRCDNEREG
jgi:hypothetical protein